MITLSVAPQQHRRNIHYKISFKTESNKSKIGFGLLLFFVYLFIYTTAFNHSAFYTNKDRCTISV